MKKITLIISLLTGMLFARAQPQDRVDSWKVLLSNKLLINTSKESEEKNVKVLKAADLKKSGYFEIVYKESTNAWYRSFFFVDELGNEIYRSDTTTHVKIKMSVLRSLFNGKKEIKIYTSISPRDPNLAVRVRPVHIFTLKLK